MRKRSNCNRTTPGPSSLGLLYWRQNDRSRALEEFHKAVMSDPDLAEAHYNLRLSVGAIGKSGRSRPRAE